MYMGIIMDLKKLIRKRIGDEAIKESEVVKYRSNLDFDICVICGKENYNPDKMFCKQCEFEYQLN